MPLQQQSVSSNNAPLFKLAALLQLEQRIRWTTCVDALRFVLVNDLKKLLPYQHAVLCETTTTTTGGFKVTAVSGVVEPDVNAPFIQAVQKMLKAHEPTKELVTFALIEEMPLDAHTKATLLEQGQSMACLTLSAPDGNKPAGYLLLLRNDAAWGNGELHIMTYVRDACAHALMQMQQTSHRTSVLDVLRRRWFVVCAMMVLLVVAAIPVRISILAPAEIIAADPALVRAPLEGVIAQLHVKPGQSVAKGDVLLRFDTEELRTRLAVAKQVLQVAQTEYRQISQASLRDSQERIQLAFVEGDVKTAQNEIAYLKKLLVRSKVKALQDGVVILDDPYDWIGRSVSLGERIMLLADPQDTKLEAQIVTGNAIDLDRQSLVRFFPTVNPHRPVEARLDYVSYRASEAPDGTFAYRATAHWEDEAANNTTLGMKGTAKLYGARLPLILHPVRKPIIWMRQWLGV